VSATSDVPTTSVSSTAASPSQDSAVTISPEGAAIAAQDASSTQSDVTTQSAAPSNTAGGTTDASNADSANDPSATDSSSDASANGTTGNSDTSGGTTNASPLKSFTYGTLGLERPDQSQDNRNPFYTAGRWLAAGLTIGGIISLLV
jgi:hypothetical protein